MTNSAEIQVPYYFNSLKDFSPDRFGTESDLTETLDWKARFRKFKTGLQHRIMELEQAVDAHIGTGGIGTGGIVDACTSVCETTREVAFAIDLAASLWGKSFLDSDRIPIQATIEEFQRADELMARSAKYLESIGESEFAIRIERYIHSTKTRAERLIELSSDGLAANYRRILSDGLDIAPSNPLPKDASVKLPTSQDGFVFTAMQWNTHRLGWLLVELSLESGPFYNAIQQHLRLASSAMNVNKRILTTLHDRSQLEYTLSLDQLRRWLYEADDVWCYLVHWCLTKSSEIAREVHGDKDDSAKAFTVELKAFVREFAKKLNTELDAYVARESGNDANELKLSTPRSSEEASRMANGQGMGASSQLASLHKVLLLREENAPLLWTACGLEAAVIVFGATEQAALEEFEKTIAVYREMGSGIPMRNRAVSEEYQSAFDAGKRIEWASRQIDARVTSVGF